MKHNGSNAAVVMLVAGLVIMAGANELTAWLVIPGALFMVLGYTILFEEL